MAATPAVLAVDVGSTTTKAAAVTMDGRLLGLHRYRTPYCTSTPPAFEIEMNMLATSTLFTMGRVLSALRAQPDDIQIQAIAITALGDGVCLIGADGEAIEPALVWRDTRSINVLRRWRHEGRLRAVARYTGTRPTAAHQTTQLAWLAEVTPEKLKQAQHVCFAEDWIGYVLTGCVGICTTSFEHTYGHPHTVHSQRRPTSRDDYWRVAETVLDILDLCLVRRLLPEPFSPLRPRGTLKRSIAAQIGLPEGLPVFVGPFDVVTGMFGLGAAGLNQAASIIGTAAIHQHWTRNFDEDTQGYLVSHIQDENLFLRFIATSAGIINLEFWGKILYANFEDNLGFWIFLENQLSNISSDGLIYLPYLSLGEERGEEKEWSLGGCFLGLDSRHTREHLMRAVYEGIAVQAARIYDLLLRHARTHQLEEIRIGGGGARGGLLAKLIAELTGIPVVYPCLDEIGLVGVAAVVWTALHPNSSLSYWMQNLIKSTEVKRFMPNTENSEYFKNLKNSVSNIVDSLAR
jgi:erythritol kinase